MYPFKEVEKKYNKKWTEANIYKCEDMATGPKAYVLEMLPYPSGRLHMGHVRNYAIGDAIARYKKMNGYQVLHPMGWDAFGLPAENAAREIKADPAKWTYANIAAMRDQLKSLGLSYDWGREFATCDVDYYGHEQKLFLEFYKNDLAYRTETWVNWDPIDQCVLANEQVVNGRGWRSGALVEKRKLRQWSFRITNYAQELLDDIDTLEGWPDKVRAMQRNWIGRSEGALIKFKIQSERSSFHNETIEIFTTRPETIFGASFIGISFAHPLAEKLALENQELSAFIEECQHTSTSEEDIATQEKKGFDTGLKVMHPFIEGHTLPVYIANFVLMEYGTGAIFACPGHDERDHEFAMKYNLPVIQVIQSENDMTDGTLFTGHGKMIASSFLDGMHSLDARAKIIKAFEAQGIGEGKITFRLRDWGVSRQRFWGCPIPIIYCDDCGIVPIPLKDLPLKLPEDASFESGGNPLDIHPTWKHVNCPACGNAALRETDTLDTFVESSWYFLRYCSPHSKEPFDKTAVDSWVPVDNYIGGVEHAVMHLLYSRFFTKALRDLGYLTFDEPFKNLMTQGMVCHHTYKDQDGKWLLPIEVMKGRLGYIKISDGSDVKVGRSEKMSKSKKNVVDPAEILDSYGADTARLFVLSDTPPERDFDWSEESLDGSWRYVNRLWRLTEDVCELPIAGGGDVALSLSLQKQAHQTIKKVEFAFERYAFNKAIAFCRELSNKMEDNLGKASPAALKEAAEILVLCLSPILPYLCQALWEKLGHDSQIFLTEWPKADPQLVKVETVTIVVQVNGKLRGNFEIEPDADKETLEQKALNLPEIQKLTKNNAIKKIIVVPGRLVNIVIDV